MDYFCQKCNKNYESYSGLFRHNKKYHLEDFNNQQLKTTNTNCQYCHKQLSSYTCRWRHEKKCKSKNPDVSETIKELQEKVTKLEKEIKYTKNINSNNVNSHNTNNNIICVFPLGKEPNNILPIKDIEKTLTEHGLNSVIEIVKMKHFNPELPQYHNFCVTSKNDIYANIVDPETKKIKYVNKKDVFDKVYNGVVSNVEYINKTGKQKLHINETINKIKNISSSKKILKKLHVCINEEAYHNQNLVKNTWENAKFDFDNKMKIELNNICHDKNNKKIILFNQIQDLINEINNIN
jgi:hypothetical protein